MTPLWMLLLAVVGLLCLVALWRLDQQRRLLVGDPQRRFFFVQRVLPPPRATSSGVPRPARAEPIAAPTMSPSPPAADPDDQLPDEGVLYIDTAGRCTLADRAARVMLRWTAGELTLADLLAGGAQEAIALLQSVARHGQVDHHATALAGAAPMALDISAVALRDRDDNFWGAALLIHRLAADPPATLSPH